MSKIDMRTHTKNKPDIYLDSEWQDRDGLGWNVEFNDSNVVHRFATESEARKFAKAHTKREVELWEEVQCE